MAPRSKASHDDGALTALFEKIRIKAQSMKRTPPTFLILPGKKTSILLTDAILDQFASGIQYSSNEWIILGGILIGSRDPEIEVMPPIGSTQNRPIMLALDQKRFRITFYRNTDGTVFYWCICLLEGGQRDVGVWTVQRLTQQQNGLRRIASDNLGIEEWKLLVKSHQETSLDGQEHAPYQDAILFDMLLDLAIDEFKPHTRTIEDGPQIQLEILEALAKVQQEAEMAAGIGLNKRRLTVQERLDGKRLKRE
ncbi:hypothetical protein CC80DRAFT_554581 [Byssothecium circinans]|uniref:Uncharacterized protein n=1 Tax=Byssothecium circinans TaxID=147558 RepID=A0A6A5TCU8_9PLEO|nr:hypothetical protein CC80DRAFT_554581 [Byssothecium circinans]